ncbi:MAG: cysteine-rich small domain-containing protein [Methanotrichaceae archaeon]
MRRLNCERYPCHFPEQDCAFCFCPFYPCMDERTKGHMKGDIWACDDCTVIHSPEISGIIMDALMGGKALSEAWNILVERV